MSDRTRRAILGATGAALTTALAGCNDLIGGGNGTPTGTPTDGGGGGAGGGAEPGDTETPAGTETEDGFGGTETETEGPATPGQQTPQGGPASVDQWLTETSVGGAAGNYDGDFVDMTGQSSVGIDVGAQGNGGNLAFEPVAVVVSPGTEVNWEWTGEGGPHNVEAMPDEQLNASDFRFTSGEPQSGADVTFARTFSQPGVALYHCDQHLGAGMKGGIVVE